MSTFEKIQRYLGKKPEEKSAEELRIEPLRGRIKALTEERERLTEQGRGRPKDWGVSPRFEQINQEIENITREIDGQPPLIFHGSKR
jgi:hypothetical protein